MEGAVETREINPYYPLEFLERGGDKINANKPTNWAIKLMNVCQKRYPECEVIIDINQPEKKLRHSYRPPDQIYRIPDDWPKPSILITNQYTTTNYPNGKKTIQPTEYLMIVNVDTETLIQDNPPIKKIELLTLFNRDKTKSLIRKELGRIPKNWQFNPLPRR